MVEVLLEYFRVCLEYDLGILLVTQTIFLRLIIETKQFGLLCSLIQFHSLRDSQELAEILVFLGSEINNKYRCKRFYNNSALSVSTKAILRILSCYRWQILIIIHMLCSSGWICCIDWKMWELLSIIFSAEEM